MSLRCLRWITIQANVVQTSWTDNNKHENVSGRHYDTHCPLKFLSIEREARRKIYKIETVGICVHF
jgi:hypothetical protein